MRFSRLFAIVQACAWVYLAGAEAVAGVPLVVEGEPAAAVVVQTRRDWETESRRVLVEAHAAAALQANVRQMSGAALPLLDLSELVEAMVEGDRLVVPGQPYRQYVLVGDSDVTRRLGVDIEGLSAGGFRLVAKGNWVALVAHPAISHPREDGGGIRQAVRYLLEQQGCHYLWPGELGKVTPSRASIEVAEQALTVNPTIVERRIRPGPTVASLGPQLARLNILMEDYEAALGAARATRTATLAKPFNSYVETSALGWLQWHGLGGNSGLGGGHAFGDAWEKWGAEHPEWFALQADGTRDQSQAGSRERFCVSNPGLAAAIADEIVAAAEKHPEQRCFSICPNDGGYSSFCMCDACKALDPPNGPKVTLLVFDKVGQSGRHPVEYVSLTDRYVHFANAIAERVAAQAPEALLLMQAYHVYSAPPVREKLHPNLVVRYVPSDMDGWSGWRAAGARRMYWRPNILGSGAKQGLLRVQAKALAEFFNRASRDDLIATDMDSLVGHWSTHGFSYYAAARLNWDPALSYEELLAEYGAQGFGPAAGAIAAYLREAEAEPLSLARVELLRGHLREADALAGGDTTIRERIAFVRLGLNYTHLFLELNHLNGLAEEKQAYDGAYAASLLTLYYCTLRDIAMHQPLALNVPVIVKYSGHFAQWSALGARNFEPPPEVLASLGYTAFPAAPSLDAPAQPAEDRRRLTGHEESLADMLAAFGLGDRAAVPAKPSAPPARTIMEADGEGEVFELPAD